MTSHDYTRLVLQNFAMHPIKGGEMIQMNPNDQSQEDELRERERKILGKGYIGSWKCEELLCPRRIAQDASVKAGHAAWCARHWPHELSIQRTVYNTGTGVLWTSDRSNEGHWTLAKQFAGGLGALKGIVAGAMTSMSTRWIQNPAVQCQVYPNHGPRTIQKRRVSSCFLQGSGLDLQTTTVEILWF